MRFFFAVSLLVALAVHAQPALGQDRFRRSLTISPSAVAFDGFGGAMGAVVNRLSLERSLGGAGGRAGLEASALAVVMLEKAVVIPECFAGPCDGRESPDLISGMVVSLYRNLGRSPVRATAGIGYLFSSGNEGTSTTSSAGVEAGLDWRWPRSTGLGLTARLRVFALQSPIAGARTLVLPGVGVLF